MSVKNIPQSNAELRKMAQAALENWQLDAETDPNGDIKAGLDYYAADGDAVPDSDISGLFEGFKTSLTEWDILEELAKGVGCQR